jgi:hypothetical protein
VATAITGCPFGFLYDFLLLLQKYRKTIAALIPGPVSSWEAERRKIMA